MRMSGWTIQMHEDTICTSPILKRNLVSRTAP